MKRLPARNAPDASRIPRYTRWRMWRGSRALWLVLLTACPGGGRDSADLSGLDNSQDGGDGGGSNIDPLAPVVAFSALPGHVKGGGVLHVAFTIEQHDPLVSLQLTLVRDDTSADPALALATGALAADVPLPESELPAAHFELIATDTAGRIGRGTSSAIHIDITPPDFVLANLASAPLTDVPEVWVTLPTCPEPDAQVSISEDPAAPWDFVPCAPTPVSYSYLLGGEGVHTLYVFLADAVGNIAAQTTALSVDHDLSPPAVQLLAPLANTVLRPPGSLMIEWSAYDAHLASLSLAYFDGVELHDIALGTLNDGHELWTLPGDGSYQIRLYAVDALGHETTVLSSSVIVDGTAPVFDTTTINYDDQTLQGDAYSGTVFVQVRLAANDPLSPPLSFRIREASEAGNCQSLYADDDWTAPTTSPASVPLRLSPVDGIKKVCAWAKDTAGNISVIQNPTAATGPDRDTIAYYVDDPPEVTTFDVVHGPSGTTISWTIEDAAPEEGLAAAPISLSYYTASAGWQTIADDVGDASPTLPYSDTYEWSGRPAESYQVRIVARDKNGNTSIPVISDLRPAELQWSIVAGNPDLGLGGSARSFGADWFSWLNQVIAVHPATGDVYLHSRQFGVCRLDARTGLVEPFVAEGTDNLLSNGGDWPAAPSASRVTAAFDSAGRLYLKTYADAPATGSIIYQVDLDATPYRVRKYIGGGLSSDETTATPDTIFVPGGALAFDEERSLYFFSSCEPGQWRPLPPYVQLRLFKVTQQADGTAGTFTALAGSCATATTPPSYPLVTPLDYALPAGVTYPHYSAVSAFPHLGKKVVYFGAYPGATFKLIDGVLHTTAFGSQSGDNTKIYAPKEGKLYTASGPVERWTVGSEGLGGELLDAVWVAAGGTGDASHACSEDEVSSANACASAETDVTLSADGTVLFVDGPRLNSPREYRVRYVDGTGLVRTLLGTLPFVRHGLARHVVRGSFGGIHYKDNTTGGFPPGLYFGNADGPVLGRINLVGVDPWSDPNDDLVEIIWGNQSGADSDPDPLVANRLTSLGVTYAGGNGRVMGIHPTRGRPWIRSANRLAELEFDAMGDHIVHWKQTGTSGFWENAVTGTLSSSTRSYVYGGLQNLVWKNDGVFFIGAYHNPTVGIFNFAKLSFFDFAPSGTVLRIMDGQANGTPSDGPIVIDDGANNTTLPEQCLNSGRCTLHYDANVDTLYFSEANMIRGVSGPTSGAPSIDTLLFVDTPYREVGSYSFRPNTNEVYFVSNGSLFMCTLAQPADNSCASSRLGPPTMLPNIGAGPNQLTWYDDDTLLISTGGSYIYRYLP